MTGCCSAASRLGTNTISFPYEIIRTGSKLVVVGDHFDGVRERIGITRMAVTTGGYDSTFSGDGRVLYRIFPREHDLLNRGRCRCSAAARSPSALVAFDQGVGDDFVFAEQAFVRLNANGTLDTTFHGDGIVIVSDDTSDVTWEPDGSAFAGRPVGETGTRSGDHPGRDPRTRRSPGTDG